VTIGTDVQNIPGNLFAGHNSINTVNYNAINCTSAGSNENGRPFNGCTNITNVNIGEGVQIIPPYLFCGCSRLISIRIPDATTEIGRFAFASCTSLSSAIIGNGTTKIGEYSFNNCLRLTSVILGENIFSIEKHAFENCGIIGELVLPQSVTTIGYEGFKDCFGINKITCLGRVAPVLETDYYYPDVFAGVDSNISINIPCGSTNMYAGRWARFHNFHEMPFVFYAISENNNKGTVTIEQQPSCADPYAVIRATPKPGYHFDHWSDGNTSNPYSYTATGSTTLIGYFGRNAGIEDVESDDYRIVTENGSIKVLGVENMNVIIYDMMGRCVAMANTGASIAVPNSGVYMVKVGNLPIKKVVMLK
jgi:hypothetical protein